MKEVPIYRGGGGGSRTIYKDRNIIIEKEVEKIIYVNQTEEEIEEPIETEEGKSLLLFYILCGIIILAIIFMWYRVVKKHKKEKEKENEK